MREQEYCKAIAMAEHGPYLRTKILAGTSCDDRTVNAARQTLDVCHASAPVSAAAATKVHTSLGRSIGGGGGGSGGCTCRNN